jgi:hypothetical protein
MYYIQFETASGNKKEKAFNLKRDAEAYFFEMVEWSDNVFFTDDKCRIHNEYPSAYAKAFRN